MVRRTGGGGRGTAEAGDVVEVKCWRAMSRWSLYIFVFCVLVVSCEQELAPI